MGFKGYGSGSSKNDPGVTRAHHYQNVVELDLDILMGARRSKENAQIAVCSSLLDATTQNNYFYNTSFTSQALSVGEACPVTDLLLTNLTLSQTSSDVQGFVNPPRVRGKGQGFLRGFSRVLFL